MPFTAHLLQMSNIALFFLISTVFILFALAGLCFIRRIVPKDILKTHNDVSGFVFATLGVMYAVILAFVMVTVWEEMSDSKERAQSEADSAIAFYKCIQLIDKQSVAEPLANQLKRFADSVIEKEYPAMRHFEKSPETQVEFEKLWRMIGPLNPQTDKEIVIYDHMLSMITRISELRAMRYHDMNEQVPNSLWFTIILGGIITVGFTWLFGSEKLLIHTIISCSLSLLIAMVVYVIIILDHPYTGEVRIQPEGYQLLSSMINAP